MLFVPSPRDIPEIKKAISKLSIDTLWVKYFKQENAYNIARDYFLRDFKYTHLVICPDDLIITSQNLEMLLLSAIDGKVISGWCTNTINENWKEINDSSISETLPYKPPHKAKYDSYNFLSVKEVLQRRKQGHTIIKINFSGFVLQVIPRRVLEIIPFRGDNDCCTDANFALDLADNRIDQYANLMVRTVHLRRKKSELQVGKKKEEIIFVPKI